MASIVSKGSDPGKIKLIDRVLEAIRVKHYSLRTEQTYIDWIKRFIIFHGKRQGDVVTAKRDGKDVRPPEKPVDPAQIKLPNEPKKE